MAIKAIPATSAFNRLCHLIKGITPEADRKYIIALISGVSGACEQPSACNCNRIYRNWDMYLSNTRAEPPGKQPGVLYMYAGRTNENGHSVGPEIPQPCRS